MAEHHQQIDFAPVTAEDILAERQSFWNSFTKATAYTIGATALVLVFIKLVAG